MKRPPQTPSVRAWIYNNTIEVIMSGLPSRTIQEVLDEQPKETRLQQLIRFLKNLRNVWRVLNSIRSMSC